jgi:hypothetical protein
MLPGALSRGIGTLPGGIPIMKVVGVTADNSPKIVLQGGIGVFFPGPMGDASYEQGFVPGSGQSGQERMNSPLELEAEYMAFAAVGGIFGAEGTPVPGGRIGKIAGIDPLPGVGLPLPAPATVVPDTIFLGGIELPLYGPGPIYSGTQTLVDVGKTLGVGDPLNGMDMPLTNSVDGMHRNGLPVANGWLVGPHAGSVLTQADVMQIVQNGIDAANAVRAAIRLPLGSTTRMVFAVTDTDGTVLGLYRMQDATTFSIDVAVSKARNVSYYDSTQLKPVDQVVDKGVSFTNRTFRFLAEPRYPAGIDETHPPPFSTLNDPGIDPATAENIAGEVAYLKRAGRASFERPYGLAWLLQLSAELRSWDDSQAREWASVLQPLESEAASRLKTWLPKLHYPIRIGEHDQTAFSFGLMWDWAGVAGDAQMRTLLADAARRVVAVELRHADVEQHHIGNVCCCRGQRFLSRCRSIDLVAVGA